MRFYIAFFLAFVASLQAAIVPAGRLVDWSTAGINSALATTAGPSNSAVGKHLGSNIPNRTTIGVTVTNAPYYASGSETTTTGTIAVGSTTLAVASTSTFTIGQQLVIAGTKRTTQGHFVVTAGASATGIISVAVHGLSITTALAAGDTINQVATKMRATTWYSSLGGITASGTGPDVYLSYDDPGSYAGFSTDSNNTGCTGTWTSTVGVAVYAPAITAISGLNITVSLSPTTGATSAVVAHADGIAIQNAINATPAGEVCYIPAGTYAVGSLVIPSNITVRGAGMNLTILKQYTETADESEGMVMGSQVNYNSPQSHSSELTSADKGDATLTLTDATFSGAGAVSVDDHLIISELNDPSFVSIVGYSGGNQSITYADGWDTLGTRCRGQIVRVISVAGTTIGIEPALYSNYTRTPWATKVTPAVVNSGIESLTLYAISARTPARNVMMNNTRNCWMYDVKVDYTTANYVAMRFSLHCEIRKCYFYEAFVHTSGVDGEVGLSFKTSHSLVIDNIMERSHISVIASTGAAGNVVAYNYTTGEYDGAEAPDGAGSNAMQFSILMNHGAHPQFNLVEGNITQKLCADRIWGSSSHGLWARNWAVGRAFSHSPYNTRSGLPGSPYELFQASWTMDLYDSQTTYSIVGNIIGDSTTGAAGFLRYVDVNLDPSTRSYFASPKHLIVIGFFASGNNSKTSQMFPTTDNLIFHANRDFSTTPGLVYDGAIADHVVPDSYFLASKPLWMGDRPFPSFDLSATTAPAIDQIPAGYRYLHHTDGYLPGGSAPAAPSSLTATTGSASVINLAWTDNASDETGYQVRRGTASGALTLLATTASNATSYSSTSLAASTHYWFDVRAVNASGNSSYTAEANATTSALAAPTWAPPLTPTVGQEYILAGRVWVFNGTGWIRK